MKRFSLMMLLVVCATSCFAQISGDESGINIGLPEVFLLLFGGAFVIGILVIMWLLIVYLWKKVKQIK
jgi:hypothetical protein